MSVSTAILTAIQTHSSPCAIFALLSPLYPPAEISAALLALLVEGELYTALRLDAPLHRLAHCSEPPPPVVAKQTRAEKRAAEPPPFWPPQN